MAIYDGTFTKYEEITSTKLNTMVSAINAHNHNDRYYTEAQQSAKYDKVKASAGDGSPGYLDSKVDSSTINVTANQLTVGNLLGTWSNESTSGTAPTDGFIHYYMIGYTGGVFGSSGGTTRTQNQGSAGGYGGVVGMTFPVKKGDAWSVSYSGTVKFISFGS